ncbi:MAG: 4-hydroxybenzoate octaprenyltransferase [Bdellovibrionales bacterium]
MKAQNHQIGKSDIQQEHWIIKTLPKLYKPYALLARVDRPIGVWLLALPGLWGIWLASDDFTLRAVGLSCLFLVGAFVMRSAGCVINDIWDRDLDRRVERTKGRPLAAGDVSLKQALMFLLALLGVGLLVLMQMNATTIMLGFLSLPLIFAYPLMKRITFWPQAFLGLTFNFGVLMGWSAMTEAIGLPALLLYVGAIFWTLAYDTVYAHQDIEDDMKIGVKSTAIRFGEASKVWVSVFYLLALKCMVLAFCAVQPLAALALLPVAGHMVFQIISWKPENAKSSLKVFQSNRDCGFLILAAALVAAFI